MILYKREHVAPILRLDKIQTRRRGKRRWKVGSIHQAKLNYFSKPFAKLEIVSVYQERLGDISEDDARREGYPSVALYIEAFKRIYGDWDPDEIVWVVNFKLIAAVCPSCGKDMEPFIVDRKGRPLRWFCPQCTKEGAAY